MSRSGATLPEPTASAPRTNPRRAYAKIATMAAVLGIVLGGLITFVDREAFSDLRHHLTLWLVLAIVVIVNITSLLLFALFWAIYRWIKRDLEPAGED